MGKSIIIAIHFAIFMTAGLGSNSAWGMALPKSYFILTEIFRSSASTTSMYGDIGYFDFKTKPGKVIYNYFNYTPSNNSAGFTNGTRHLYLVAGVCTPGQFRFPQYNKFSSIEGSIVSASDGNFIVKFGTVTHKWQVSDSVNGVYSLVRLSGGGVSQFVGVGVFSDQIRTQETSITQFKSSFNGYIIQNNGNAGSLSDPTAFPYLVLQTGFTPSIFRGSGGIYGYLYPLNDGHSIWGQSSLVVGAGTFKTMVWAHGGHIYDQTDCYSEANSKGGHKTVMFGAWNNLKGVNKFVTFQYSYQSSGVPIISIGVLY
ncbi:MAG: hypothetical protein AB7P49_09000 [Bdellovibrionales bacterium]